MDQLDRVLTPLPHVPLLCVSSCKWTPHQLSKGVYCILMFSGLSSKSGVCCLPYDHELSSLVLKDKALFTKAVPLQKPSKLKTMPVLQQRELLCNIY